MLKKIQVEGHFCSMNYTSLICYQCPFCRVKKRNKFTDTPKYHYHGICNDRSQKEYYRGNHCEINDIPEANRPNYQYEFIIKNDN
jgi:hypothetical protein